MKRNASIIFLLLAVVCFFAQRKGASANFVYQQQKPFITNLAPPNTFTVNTLGDNADNSVGNGQCDSDAAAGDQCTLRAAIQEVNFAGAGTINFSLATGSIIVLSSALPNIASNVAFDGPTTRVIISGNNNSRVLTVDPGKTVTISNLMIANGRASSGGGINNAGTLTLTATTVGGDNSSVLGNRTNDGADVSGALTGGNGGDGGGIYNTGTLRLINCTVSGNQTGRGGNTSTGDGGNGGNGGGIYNSGTLTLTNSTVANNQTGARGNTDPAGPGNFGNLGAGGGIFSSAGTLTLNNTIVAKDTERTFFVADDINGVVDSSSSFNLIGSSEGLTGIDGASNGNQMGTSDAPLDPLISPLQDNGGPTWTHLLLDFSPATDMGSNAQAKDQNNIALTTDQRGTGFPRIVHGTVDIGSVEIPFTPPPPSADIGVTKIANVDSSLADTDVVYTITVTNAGPDAAASAALNDPLPGSGPSRMTFVSLSAPVGWSCSTPSAGATGTVNCTNPSLAVTAGQVFTLVGHIPPGTGVGTAYHNIATVTTTTPDPSSENNSSSADTSVFSCLTNPIVTTNANSGAGSLRQAIQDACDGATINFDMSQVVSPITLTSGELLINKNLTIQGPGASQLTVSGNNASRVFNVQSGITVSITDLTIANGKVSGATNGGGVLNNGTLTLTNCNLFGNSTANNGGGIFNSGPSLTLNNCNIGGAAAGQSNTATFSGAGVFSNSGTLTITAGSFVSNSAGAQGGGAIQVAGGTATINGVLISQNHAFISFGGGIGSTGGTTSLVNSLIASNTGSAGGALWNNGGTITVVNSTLSGNSATGAGGGVRSDSGTLTLTNVTLTNNRSDSDNSGGEQGGGIFRVGGTVTLQNTLVAGNFRGPSPSTTADDINGALDSSSSFNLIGTGGSGGLTNGVNNNQVGVSAAGLAPLAGNGGPTQTHALLPGSPALDAASNTLATNAGLTTDQRGSGFARAVDGPDADTTDTVDIGAFEAQISVEDITDKTTNEDTQLQFTFNVGGASSITSVTAVSGNIALVPNDPANIAVSGSGATRTLTINPLADKFGTSTITVTVNGNNSQSMTDTFVLTVNPAADTPSVTNATTNEDTQTTSGLVISRNPVDGAEVTHFKITAIANGSLYKSNGTTQINNGDFITVVEGNQGLKFTPAANLFSPSTTFSFLVQAATSAGGNGLSNTTPAIITVNPVADTPSVTNATTTVNTQTTSGLVITRNPADSTEVTNFKITNIQNGTLFKNDGTQITNGQFITVAEGNAGLKFTPALNSNAAGSFQVQASLSNTNGGLGGGLATATITINCSPTVVTNSNDSGAGSLRAIINSACSDSTITFDPAVTGTITLTTGQLAISKSLTIQGPGANLLTVSGNNNSRVFNVNVASPGAVTFSGLTISKGSASGGPGGGILNQNTGTVNVTNSTLSQNSASTFGGGIANVSTGTVTVTNSTLSQNSAPGGGGISNFSTGTVNVINSTLSQNSSPTSSGGGIRNEAAGTVNVTNSTLSQNSARAAGGIANFSTGTINVINSTLTQNSTTAVGGGGGAIYNDNTGTVNVTNSTLSQNSANNFGGAILNISTGPVVIRNSIIALNTITSSSGPDLNGAFTSQGHNLIGKNDTSTGFTPGTNNSNGDLVGTSASPIDPLLAPLANYGGPTQTMALLPGSLALDGGDNCVTQAAHCGDANIAQLTTDQRGAGFARLIDGPDANTTDTVDIGAFEAQVSVEDITDKATNEDTQLQFTFNIGGGASITSVTAVSGNVGLVPNNVANIALSGSGATRTLTINPIADTFGTSTITVTVNGNNSQSMTDTFVLTVNPVADTPSVTNATTNEDTQTTSGLVISKNPVDGAEVTHFKITAIANGSLFKSNGTTQINNGDFITVVEGTQGLKFTPAANLFSPSTTFSFLVQAATSAGGNGLSNTTPAIITVNPVADTPSVTNATTTANTQTTSGLVITRNPADSTEVTNFKITNIQNGTLFKNDGTTQINNNDFITVAEGNAALKFTPANNSSSAGMFQVQASTSNSNAGLGGSVVTATITVNCGGTLVTSGNDSGAGSLRAIINSACPGSTITFDTIQIAGPITLTSGELLLNKSLTFQGPGANLLTIQRSAAVGTALFSIFSIFDPTVTTNISGLTLSNADSNANGGAIRNSGSLTVNNVTLSGNHTTAGGAAIFNGGIGTVTLLNSTLSGNRSDIWAAIYTQGTTATITNNTFTGNTNQQNNPGAAIFSESNSVTNVTTCTISKNTGQGGAVFQNSGGAGRVNLRNSIVSGNTGGDTSGVTDLGNNLIGGTPLLAPLANYGGPTQTMALLPGSPAINAGTNTGAPATDQRGISRVGAVDIGAFESRGFTITATNGTPQSTTITTTFATPLEATVSSAFGEPVAGGVLTFTAPASGPSGTFTGNVIAANFTIGASGMASPTFTANNLAGSYNVTATANGIASPANFSLTNTRANTFTTVTSSSNPSDLGQSVTFTATVTSVATPAGTVQFKIDGALAGGPVTLDANGIAAFTTASLTVGNHSIVADYSGNANFNPSTNSLAGSQVVRPTPSLSINDVTITEGDSGTKTMTFTVTLSAVTNQTVTVDFASVNGTAIAPADYQSTSGALTFTTGQTTKTVAVTIKGDQSFEPDETFTVNLTNPANATISKPQGTGTILNDDVQGGFISFSQGSYTVSESAGFVTLTVNRTNDTSGAATVDYATDDAGAPAACNTIGNLASARCDFTTAMGTVKFAAGETQKTFTILVNRDSFAENSELFTVNLSNLTGGAAFVTPSSATVTITNSPEGPPANLIDDASFFVRQHYHDFLNREPDAAGLAFWTNQITSCGTDAQCTDIRRINVSAAFFLSSEFQDTGGAAYLTSKAAFGVVPTYNRFERDSQALGRDYIFGAPGSAAVLEANKVAYFNDYVVRPEFTAIYGSLLNGPYVDTLIANTGVSFSQTERDALVNGLNGNTETRATVLRKITEKGSFRQAETNRMFVLMEYCGYLRRDPDTAGFNFWLNKLNQFNGNFVNADMVKAFITSGEYRGRFGP